MIILTLKGADVYLAGEVERILVPALSKVYEVDEDEIIVHAQDGFLYHDGVEQTSYNLIVNVESDFKYEDLEVQVADYILKIAKNFSVHTRVYFTYFNEKRVYSSVNPDYPLYITSKNVVLADNDSEDNDVEIYDGNIFKDLEDRFPIDEEGNKNRK